MHRYLQQLIEDFKRAGAETKYADTGFGKTDEDFDRLITEIEEGTKISAKAFVGVSYDELPPADMMTDMQVQLLLQAMLNTLSANGTEVVFPGKDIPVKLKYSELREHFKAGFYTLPGWTIDFCSGWCPDCAFSEYCSIKDDIWSQEELEVEHRKQKKDK